MKLVLSVVFKRMVSFNERLNSYWNAYLSEPPQVDDGGGYASILGLSKPSHSFTKKLQDGFFNYLLFPLTAGFDAITGQPPIVGGGLKLNMPLTKKQKRIARETALARAQQRAYYLENPGIFPFFGTPRGGVDMPMSYRAPRYVTHYSRRAGFTNNPAQNKNFQSINHRRRRPQQGRGSRRQAQPKLNPRGQSVRNLPQTISGADIKTSEFRGGDFRIQKSTPHFSALSSKIWLGQIRVDENIKMQWLTSPGINVGAQFYFNPCSTYYVYSDSAIARVATNFERYRILRGKMTFTPCSSAYSKPDWRVAAILTTSVDYFKRLPGSQFVGSPVTPTAVDTPHRYAILQNPVACENPGWHQFSCDIPSTPWLYCSSMDLSSYFSFTESTSLQRQTYAFVVTLGLGGSPPGTGETSDVFEVWMDIDLEFKDQIPAGTRDLSVVPTTNVFIPEQKFIWWVDDVLETSPTNVDLKTRRLLSGQLRTLEDKKGFAIDRNTFCKLYSTLVLPDIEWNVVAGKFFELLGELKLNCKFSGLNVVEKKSKDLDLEKQKDVVSDNTDFD